MKLITVVDLPWDRLTDVTYNELIVNFKLKKHDGKHPYVCVYVGEKVRETTIVCHIYSFDEFTAFVSNDMNFKLFKSNITNWMRIWSSRLTNSLEE